MFAKQEVRCQECGTLNRVRTYSFRQIPICGNCHRSLPENPAVKGLRSVYQWRTPLTFLVLLGFPLLFLTWIGSESSRERTGTAPVSVGSCAKHSEPREGIYKWYGPMWGRDIAELTIRTATGSKYFIKLEDIHGRPARAYFLHGGSTQTFPVPLGTFALKFATGSSWCGEEEYFGDATVYNKADRELLFEQTVHADAEGTTTLTSDVTVELIRQRGGNLPTHSISRKEF